MASDARKAHPNYPPNSTLYCRNLPEKIQKEELRRSLYMLFSTYGHVIDIVALKTRKMRGQAHVTFRDIQASTTAMRALQGFNFFEKDLVRFRNCAPPPTTNERTIQQEISYAKGKSHAIAKLDGTFKMPEAGAADVATSELQQSIFDAPPSTAQKPAIAPAPPAPEGLPQKPTLMPNGAEGPVDTPSPQGVKRRREEESEEESQPMEEDDDEGEDMDVSDED
ncbi:hypothetical protein EV356DRAFT_515414 [Viridothelium virens]|uniref:RRM domain-containing protein n=1 Tax=Viridothelium virens TaxID=1048519 RepID=A0A6A6HMU0_VIRVR|nr:hypothetical protein EV356DRAFT_515414 [Viridothelium virens]